MLNIQELRAQALQYVSYCLDDSLNERNGEPIPANAVLVGWQCGFEPLFVAVWSYLPDVTLEADEAVEIASEYLDELGWFAGRERACPTDELPVEPDFIIGGKS